MLAALKCPMCGGEVTLDAEMKIGTCDYCGSPVIVPKNVGKIGNLYNLATFYRQTNEFDRSIETYKDILKEDSKEAEAYFGLVMSKYGIEFVEDPKSHERIPTFHRTKEKSILTDPDYQKALECADADCRSYYEKQGQKIAEIQGEILKRANNEQAFDVFICYKESDDLGNRTEESVLGQELYYELEKLKIRTFFARLTLKPGEEYEPVIFSALRTAKVMLVLGCSPHNYNSVWVKNEWNRFLELRENNSGKVIIPCYKNCSPYELPRELAVFQALDMNKIGFLQEVIAGIRKIVSEESATEELSDVNRLCKNAETFYNLGDKKKAEEIYIDLTNNYPDDYRGWWGAASVKTDRFRLYSRELFQQIEGVVNNAFQVAKTSEREQIQPVWDAYLVLREERKLEEEKQKNKLHYQKYTERIENDKSQLEDARKRRAFYESEYPTDGSRLKSLCEERAAREDAIRKIQEDEKRLSGPTNAGNKVRKLGWIIGIGFCVFLLGGNFLSNIGNDIGFSGWLQAIIGSAIMAAILIGIAFAVAGAMDGAVMGKNKLTQNNLNKQQKREEEALKSIVKEINMIEPRKQEYDKVCALITRLEEDIKSAENDRSKLQGRM